MKAGVRAVFSNGVAERAKPETVSATPVKAWVSTERRKERREGGIPHYQKPCQAERRGCVAIIVQS